MNKPLPNFYHGKSQKSKEIVKAWGEGYAIENGSQPNAQ
jgi:hypothetical protein